ncbi:MULTISPECIES: 16S rRNA (cytosine(967)-C(5))-methyltransferase RsmB [unclassified Breznakia]|uniref:16S rRNA (cytosine(967)-C(5))-methyltransferase RsmB n=1 Tax=unclassified Breznakia TaxID=2623764 RepID=UPI002406157D|nr:MULTISPECIES: 16S rRNA (cytosine(967)-C(5))-methyltransferase RsmB [unclassified Breznakia]MDF9838564.1 16S rRNA (cytosine967-C5)-methyltransferase [Breznakia sp. PFB2-8]MDF9860589.1 16S rRNA (cytosine967-C5)-methyltransferase [Breznakia sp. PH5-24]
MTVREKAYRMLIDICIHKKYSHLVLKDGMKDFSNQDKALISTIVYGTLQNYRYLDYQWKVYCEKLVKKEIEILINMSVYQLLFLDRIPAFAITNEAVEISKKKYDGKFEKFVNAILRRVIKEGKRPLEGDEDEILAIETSFPLWMVKMWNKQYGKDVTRKLCLDALKTPNQTVRVNTIKTDKKALLKGRDTYIEGNLSPDALIFKKGSVAASEDFKYGYVSVQDEASQMVARFLAPIETDVVLDMCSAPGSKTAHMAALMKNKGKIVALDIHEHRIELVKATMRRLGCICVDAKACDATKAREHYDAENFDKILIDAPCSGYGVLKRKSDIKYHMQSDDMDEIIKIQASLLQAAESLLKVDGTMVYSTCTMNKKENELQVQAFLKKNPNFILDEEITIFPFTYNTDGFYMAKLKKISSL